MYIKHRVFVNINRASMKNLEISEDFCETFQCKKLNKIDVCNNLQHILYNSNDLFDGFAKTYYSSGYKSKRAEVNPFCLITLLICSYFVILIVLNLCCSSNYY